MYGSWPSAGDKNVEAKAGITYEIDNQYPQEGISEYRRGIIRKYLDGQLLWELEIPEFAIDYNYWKVENEYICIYSPLWSDDYYKFALIDPNGNILFTHNFIETTQEEWIHGVTIAENSLVLITYLIFSTTNLPEYVIKEANSFILTLFSRQILHIS